MRLNRIALISATLALIVLTVPSAFGCYGKVTGGGQCVTPSSSKIPAASFGFNAMVDKDGIAKGEINYDDLVTGQHVHVHDVTYVEVSVPEPGNKPWPFRVAVFGYGVDVYSGKEVVVYVEDLGEPGKADIFYIELDGAYLGGSKTVPILSGNIQIHKSLLD